MRRDFRKAIKIFTLALFWELCKIPGTHEILLYLSNSEERKEPFACVTSVKGLHNLHPSAHGHTWAQHQKEHVTTVPRVNLGKAALWTWNELTVQNRKLLAIYFIWFLPSPWDHTLPKHEWGKQFFLLSFQNECGIQALFATRKWPYHSFLLFPSHHCGQEK